MPFMLSRSPPTGRTSLTLLEHKLGSSWAHQPRTCKTLRQRRARAGSGQGWVKGPEHGEAVSPQLGCLFIHVWDPAVAASKQTLQKTTISQAKQGSGATCVPLYERMGWTAAQQLQGHSPQGHPQLPPQQKSLQKYAGSQARIEITMTMTTIIITLRRIIPNTYCIFTRCRVGTILSTLCILTYLMCVGSRYSYFTEDKMEAEEVKELAQDRKTSR